MGQHLLVSADDLTQCHHLELCRQPLDVGHQLAGCIGVGTVSNRTCDGKQHTGLIRYLGSVRVFDEVFWFGQGLIDLAEGNEFSCHPFGQGSSQQGKDQILLIEAGHESVGEFPCSRASVGLVRVVRRKSIQIPWLELDVVRDPVVDAMGHGPIAPLFVIDNQFQMNQARLQGCAGGVDDGIVPFLVAGTDDGNIGVQVVLPHHAIQHELVPCVHVGALNLRRSIFW